VPQDAEFFETRFVRPVDKERHRAAVGRPDVVIAALRD
jgi:hypothetical protein